MPIPVSGQVGPAPVSDGVSTQPLRQARTGELVIGGLHGKFYEQNSRGNVYSGGMTTTSISNATFTTGTLGVTGTPIVGVWNPSTSPVNLVILQAALAVTRTALQNTGCGTFVWCSSIGNSAITTGASPLNRKTLVAAGSFAKDLSGVAMTGQTNALTAKGASALFGGSGLALAELDTAIGMSTHFTGSGYEQIEGAWIVPPGGILALMCTTTPVAHSASSMLTWEEVSV